jgi:hypothetical protein
MAANRYMLQSIANDEHRLTRHNVDAKNVQMRRIGELHDMAATKRAAK